MRASVALGLPLIGSHLAQMLTHLTDVVMLGWYSVDALAAVVLASQIYFVVFIVGAGFAFAVMPLVAHSLGAGDRTGARRAVRMGAWSCMIYAALLSLLLWHTEGVLLLLGQEAELAAIAGQYMQIALFSLWPALLIMVLKSWFSALERGGVVLASTVVAAAFNVLFNYMFIFGNLGMPELGARGAAVATLGTTMLNFLFLAGWAQLRREYRSWEIFRNPFRPDWPVLARVVSLGWPISLTLLAESGLFAAATLMAGATGKLSLAAHGIVLQIAAISFMVPLGISNVATIRAGRAMGRGATEDLYRAARVVLAWALAGSVLAMLLFVTVPEFLVSLFIDPDEPLRGEIIAIGRVLLLFAGAFQIVDALQVVGLGLLRGLQDTAVPMRLAVIGYWGLAIPFAWVLTFPLGLGVTGIWLGLVFGLAFAAGAMLRRYLKVERRLRLTGAA